MKDQVESRLPQLNRKLLRWIDAMESRLPELTREPWFRDVRVLARSARADTAMALELQIAELCLERMGAEASIRLAISTGAAFQPGLSGHWGLAALTSPNLGAALEIGAKYYAVSPYNLATKITFGDDVTTLVGRDSRPLGRARDAIAAFDIASGWHCMTTWIGAKLPTREIRLPLPKTPSAEEFERIFDVIPEFDRSKPTRFIFESSAMGAPLILADPALSAAHAEACELIIAHETRGDQTAHAVREYLIRNQGMNPNVVDVSRALATSERTLRRRLKEEGLCFGELAQDVKKLLACELLANTPLTITQIADRVGFSASSNFSAAFKHWTGSSPGTYRADQRRERDEPEAIQSEINEKL